MSDAAFVLSLFLAFVTAGLHILSERLLDRLRGPRDDSIKNEISELLVAANKDIQDYGKKLPYTDHEKEQALKYLMIELPDELSTLKRSVADLGPKSTKTKRHIILAYISVTIAFGLTVITRLADIHSIYPVLASVLSIIPVLSSFATLRDFGKHLNSADRQLKLFMEEFRKAASIVKPDFKIK